MPVTRVRPGHADLAGALKYGFNDVRNVLERASARETTARVAAGAVARAFLARARDRGLVVHRRGRGRRAGPGPLHADPRGGGAEPAALPGPGRRDGDDRPDRRGARAAATRSAASSRSSSTGFRSGSELRPLGPAARCRPRGGGHEHPDRQGRGVRARVRADAPLRLRRSTTSSRGATRTGRWIHRSNNAGRAHGRRDQRRADRRPRRRQADLDARAAAPLGGPA